MVSVGSQAACDPTGNMHVATALIGNVTMLIVDHIFLDIGVGFGNQVCALGP